jgi:Tol biopolymer transport system component
LVVCLAALLAAVASVGSAGAQAGDGLGGLIAFDHFAVSGGPEDIFTISPDGDNRQQITNTPDGEGGSELPSWTANGKRLLFDSDRAGNVHTFRSDLNGHVEQMTGGDAFEFSLAESTDGKQFAYERDSADFTSGGIVVADRHGNRLDPGRQITDAPGLATGGFDTTPEFSPDGSRLLFLRVLRTDRPSAQSAVFTIGVDGSDLKQLTPSDLNAFSPHWSPDGTQIAFSSNADNFTDTLAANVYVIDADGSDLTQVTHRSNGDHAFSPDWSPDGRHLVFTSARADDPSTSLEVMDLSTGDSVVIERSEPGTVDQDAVWSKP